MNNTNTETLGRQIHKLRKADPRRITQLAGLADLSLRSWYQAEADGNVTRATLDSILAVLGHRLTIGEKEPLPVGEGGQ